MSRTIHCAKLGIDAEGLDFAPWPGPLGQRIYAEISKPAWQQWLARKRDADGCMGAFYNNNYVGVVVLVGIVIEYSTRLD